MSHRISKVALNALTCQNDGVSSLWMDRRSVPSSTALLALGGASVFVLLAMACSTTKVCDETSVRSELAPSRITRASTSTTTTTTTSTSTSGGTSSGGSSGTSSGTSASGGSSSDCVPASSSSTSSGATGTVVQDCTARCASIFSKCGGEGSPESYCNDICGRFTETQLKCMEAAGCDEEKSAACDPGSTSSSSTSSSTTSSSGGSGSTSSSTSSTSSSGGPVIPCAGAPNVKPAGSTCAASCIDLNINGKNYCAKGCTTDDDCNGTLCAIKASKKFCASECTSNTSCLASGFTTCATGFTQNPGAAVCAY